jgi:Spy/CpxP family protein refolding chaperone
MRFKGSRKIVGGFGLAAFVALTGVVGVAQQQQSQDDDGGRGRAERPWGHEGGGKGRRDGGGGRRGGFGPFGGRFAERLNLTDAQREQMSRIEERYRATFEAQRERGRERRGDRVDPFAGGAFDEAAVRAAAQARANAQVEREVAQARMMHEMYNVLTPEQKAQLAAERQQRGERGRGEFRQRLGGDRRGQPQLQQRERVRRSDSDERRPRQTGAAALFYVPRVPAFLFRGGGVIVSGL